MRPKAFFSSVRLGVPSPPGANMLVPARKSDRKPLLSGRVTLSLLVDGSPSLDEYIERVRAGYKQVPQQVGDDPFLAERTDVSIAALGDSQPATLLCEWSEAARLEVPPLPRCGHTPLCGGIAQVLEGAVGRSGALVREHHCDEALNLVFVMSDFMPTDSADARSQMDASLRRATEAGVQLFLLAVGNVDEAFATSIAQPGRPPVPLESVHDFTMFFKAVGRSLRQRSMSMTGGPLLLEFQGRSLRGDR